MKGFKEEQRKIMKRLGQKYDEENSKIINFLKVNLSKLTYKSKDVITKFKSKNWNAEDIKIRLFELRKQGEIYELEDGYLIPLLNTPKEIKKVLAGNSYYYDPKLKKQVIKLIKKRNEPITEKEILILLEMDGFSGEEIKLVLYEFYRAGEIYKPRKGYLQAI